MIAIFLAAAFTGCGVERGPVKNLLDHANLYAPMPATVAQLRELKPPPWYPRARRRQAERMVVTVDVEVIAFKSEADGDIHAIIRDAPGQVMIAELPHPTCIKASPFAWEMRRARNVFRTLMEAHVQHIRITGVVFFDKLHGQTGVAPNGVELHPVLKVEALP